jgi:DNA-binding transcriptional LysR family regulator
MRRSDLGDLTAFVAVAEHSSFRAASVRLGVTPSALSHTMRQMEERLGVRLLNRTTRSVAITDAGQRLLQEIRPAIDRISGALDDLNEERARPSGRLRIHTNGFAALAVVVPVWSRFVDAYPDVQLELGVDEEIVDIVAREFDAGIGLREFVPADMIAVRVSGPMKVAVVGAPTYFARTSEPRTPDDLVRHSCIQYRRFKDGDLLKWRFQRDGKRLQIATTGPVTVNRSDLATRAALDGLGIAYLVEALAEPFLRSGQLLRVLESWSPSFEGLALYHSSRHQVPAALRALIDMLRVRSAPNTPGRVPKNPFAGD